MPEPAKDDRAPFVTVMSASSKFVVLSEEVNVKDKVASSEDPPSLTSAAVMVMVGGVVSAGGRPAETVCTESYSANKELMPAPIVRPSSTPNASRVSSKAS